MNLVTNEVTGLFLIPLGVKLNSQVWELVSGLGIVFIPFIVIFVSSFFEARAQGADEGSPAVLAIKLAEKGFWSMALILLFTVIPISSSLNTSYKQYSCLDEPSIAFNPNVSVSSASSTALTALGISNSVSPSLLYGITHQISTGINEALTSTLTCKKGSSVSEVQQVMTNLIPETETVYRSILEFNEQCYQVAKEHISNAMSQGKTLMNSTNTKYAWNFYPPATRTDAQLILDAYDGSIVSGATTTSISMEPSDTWFDSLVKGTNVSCSVLAQSLYEKIEDDFDSSSVHSDSLETAFNFASLFNGDITESEVKHDLIIEIFENTVNNEGSRDTKWQSASDKTYSNTVPEILVAIDESKNNSMSKIRNRIANTIVSIGSYLTDVTESAKGTAVTLIIPIMVVVFQLFLCAFLPIVAVISGYKVSVIYSWVLLYFAVTMVPFWTNLGVQIETLLLSLSSYNDSAWALSLTESTTDTEAIHVLGTTAAMFVYIIPMVWIVLVQIVGNIGASALVGAISGATSPGEKGTKMTYDSGQKFAGESFKWTKNKLSKKKTT